MMKILKWIGAGIGLFTALVIVFITMFIFQAEEVALPDEVGEDEEVLVSITELELMTAKRDTLQMAMDSLLAVLVQRSADLDSLSDVLAFRDAAIGALESRLQDKDAAIEGLREVDVNAQEMARTFATMNVEQLSPIVAELTDGVVLDIYKHTSNKRRRFLLAAMGDNRAAKLTNRLVRK
ncbi:MAG: hypothetical protein IIA59_10930 [Candidatus Marinimicrobia bacterium]|nr:hypothetical protein [Candidatus Neomarinimicrobiota bacterium]